MVELILSQIDARLAWLARHAETLEGLYVALLQDEGPVFHASEGALNEVRREDAWLITFKVHVQEMQHEQSH